jgi:hypothetical protein
MRIHCDHCEKAFDKDDAVVREVDDGELLYFCSAECAEDAEFADEKESLEDPAKLP